MVTVGCLGSPLAMEYRSVVAPPISTIIRSPQPLSCGVPVPKSSAALSTAAGVGIIILSINLLALFKPFASIMRRKNKSLMAPRAGSMFSSPKRGMTFSVCTTSVITLLKIPTTCGVTDLLPATSTGTSKPSVHNMRALWRMTSLLPPSVPPAKRIISGFKAAISSISYSLSSLQYTPSTLAPAPKAARFAASAVNSGTRPMATIFRPPAALEQPSTR